MKLPTRFLFNLAQRIKLGNPSTITTSPMIPSIFSQEKGKDNFFKPRPISTEDQKTLDEEQKKAENRKSHSFY